MRGLGNPRDHTAKLGNAFCGVGISPPKAKGMARPEQEALRGLQEGLSGQKWRWGSSRWRMRSGVGHCQQVIPPGRFLPCPERHPHPSLRPSLPPASGQAWAARCPQGLTHVRPAGPGWRAGPDPTPCLTLSGLACAQLPGRGQGLSTPHPLPALAEQSLHELMGAQGRDGQAGQWPKREVTSLAGMPCGPAHQPPAL